jgi:hypothetical protein
MKKGNIISVLNSSVLAKLSAILDSATAKKIVRFVSMCYFVYIFYMLKQYYPQINLDFQFAIRCGIVSAMASGGLFLSSFAYFQKHRVISMILLLPIFPSLFFVTPGFLVLSIIFILILLYSYVVFVCKKWLSAQ